MKNNKFCTLIHCPVKAISKCYLLNGWKCVHENLSEYDGMTCFYFVRNESEAIDYGYLNTKIGWDIYREPIQIIAALVESKK